ncbi:MAG TPA: hypothetical protein VNF91_02140 [Candidatus Acidoferrum sp.]|nr:hypothetical protein [Candidatus Acidoferrum sp.]
MTANGSKPNDPLDQVDEAIGKLEGTQWDEDSKVTHVHAAPGAVVNVDNTGKFAAVEGPTNTVNPRPTSDAPQKAANAVTSVIGAINNPWKFWALLVLVGGGLVAYWLKLTYGH